MKNRRLPPLHSLRAFEATARNLSFKKAASELGVTPTAISHHIKILEADLNLLLFIRHTRKISLTEAGEKLWFPLNASFNNIQQAVNNLDYVSKRNIVTLTAPTLFTSRYLIPAISDFEAYSGGCELRFHTTDELIDLKHDIADVAVRCGDHVPEGFHSEDLVKDSYGILCSPSCGVTSYDDLKQARLLISEHKLEGHAPGWPRWMLEAGIKDINLDKGVRFTDEGYAIQAAVAGQGVMVGSLLLARPELNNGSLINPFGPVISGSVYRAVTSSENTNNVEVKSVIEWLHRCIDKQFFQYYREDVIKK